INGDLVDVGMQEKQWDNLFGSASDSLLALPIAPVAGNHDEDKSSFIEHFMLRTPSGSPTVSGAYYSFDWSDAHFIVLNTNEDSPEWADLSPGQVEWFVEDAKAAKAAGASWIILLLHKGPYTTSNHATDADIMGQNGLRTKLASLLDDLKVDLVLQGHDHIYARSKPIKDGVAVAPKTSRATLNGRPIEYYRELSGPVYVIPSTAGPKTYFRNRKIDPSYYELFSVADEHHAAKYGPDPADGSRPLRGAVQNFMSLSVDERKIVVVAYEIDAKIEGGKPFVIDQFGLEK
ncbi:MAG: metallophosphoesterase, partial [Spirochaetaceae bacterium]|nr:metallophosphoesterase [Spirochaetaceae bacterium]